MTADALTRLVQRTLRPEPTLRPYAPSIFEAPSNDADSELLDQDVTASAPPPVWPTAPAAERVGRAEASESHAWQADGQAEHPRAEPALVEQDQPARPMPVEMTTTAVEAPREPPVPSIEHVRVVERVVEWVPADGATRPPHSPQPLRALPATSAPVAEPPRSATPAAALMPADLPPERVPAEQPPEPVISISIGRIEVRATAPAATAPPISGRPRERRVMSLDEYLERRARGSHE